MIKRLSLLLALAVVAMSGLALVSTTPTEATTSPVEMAGLSEELALIVGGFTTAGADCLSCVYVGECTQVGQKCDTGTGGPKCWCRWCVDHFVCQSRP